MTGPSNGHSYKVIQVGNVSSDLKRYHQQLMHQGKGTKFLKALRSIHERLRQDPHGFGERLYRLPTLQLVVQQGIILPLAVTFGIHDALPLVFVQVVKLLSDQTIQE